MEMGQRRRRLKCKPRHVGAKQHDHDRQQNHHRKTEQNQATTALVKVCLKSNQSNDAVEKRADERCQRLLNRGVFDEQLRSTRRGTRRHRAERSDYGAGGEYCHRQHAGCKNGEQTANRISTQLDGHVLRNTGAQQH